MNTKPFTNMFGSEVQVSREEFVKRWTDELFKFTQLFYADENEYQKVYNNMVHATEQLAGRAWDRKSGDWAEKAEAHQHDEPLCG